MHEDDSPKALWRKLGAWGGLAGEVAALLLVAAFGGRWADERLDTAPWLALGALIAATILIFWRIWRLRRWF